MGIENPVRRKTVTPKPATKPAVAPATPTPAVRPERVPAEPQRV